ncbi:MAG TPA: DUF898 family protein [Polyangiaceae bacterium]|nr:DUF898 family protein [Polyangiaceae bacterium]
MTTHAAEPAEDEIEHRVTYSGSGSVLFVLIFKNLLLTLLTLGIYLPWARTERRRYLWQNIAVGGHELRYHGTGTEMFLGYLKVLSGYLALVGLPLGIAKVDETVGRALQVAGLALLVLLLPIAIYGSRRYLLGRTSLRGIRFGLEPGVGGYWMKCALGTLLTVVTLGFYAPVMSNDIRRYIVDRSRYGTAPFGYDGTNAAVFRLAMRGSLLCLLTSGLYYPWFIASLARFRVQSAYIHGARGKLTLTGGDVLVLFLVGTLGTFLTFGLGFPWVATYVLRTLASRLSFVGPIEWSAIGQRAASGNAAGDDLANALDVGLEL